MVLALQQAYINACLAEIEALKPGNVHIYADGHDMQVKHFIQSAEASAPQLCKPECSVGNRILNAVNATQQAVQMNTNLGILLLCAPLLQARQSMTASASLEALHAELKRTLSQLSIADGQAAAKAIVMANPAGLGSTSEMDVKQSFQASLLEMMQFASEKDLIARQYANNFAALFERGVLIYQEALDQWQVAWATSWVYLHYLTNYLDTHILRKYGDVTAKTVQQEACEIRKKWQAAGGPEYIKSDLLKWDKSLKKRKLNPGTSADMTVATVLISHLSKSL